jgi:predicted NBD/HSP70 family sugar kinase
MLAVDPDGGLAIGVHITPTRVRSVLVNLAGTIVGQNARQLTSVAPEAAFPVIGDLVEEMRSLRPKGRHLGVGLAMPGPFDVETMSFVGPTTIEGWRGIPIRERLEEVTGLPGFIGMDAGAAALGERLYGAGRNLKDFFYLYFGIGLGGGTVQEGVLWRGAFGNAGEVGHLPLVPDGEACPCGSRGCLERYLSVEALSRRFAAAGLDFAPLPLDRLVDERHPVLMKWIGDVGPLLGRAVAAIENLLDPETMIVGGNVPPLLIEALIEAASPLPPSVSQRIGRTTPRVIRSEIGVDAALLGAAVLAISGALSPRFGFLFADAEGGGDPIVGRQQRRAYLKAV